MIETELDALYKQARDLILRGDLYLARNTLKGLSAEGYAPAQNTYAAMLSIGDGGPQSKEEAAKYFELAAGQGDRKGQGNFARILEKRGDFSAARRYFRLAADQGSELSQLEYARYAQEGLGGPVDLNEAATYYRKAALQGSPSGRLYYNILTGQN